MMGQDDKRPLNALAIDLAATKIVLRALIEHLLLEDATEAAAAIDELTARVGKFVDLAIIGSQTLSEASAGAAREAIREAAVGIFAGLRPEPPQH